MSVDFTAPADLAPASFTASVMAVPVPPVVNTKPGASPKLGVCLKSGVCRL